MGYFILLFVDIKLGLLIKIIAPLFVLGSFIKHNMWDVLFLTGVFLFIDIAKMIQLIL